NRLLLNRDIHYVTEPEYSAIKRYINNPSLHKPDLLKPSLPARPSSIRQIRELLELKGENISIPPEVLSQRDTDRLFDWLIHRGEPSETIKRLEAKSLAAHFLETIRDLPPGEKTVIQEYRNVLQELINCGYNADDLETIKESALSMSKSVQYNDQTVATLKEEYRKLKELARCVRLADDIPASILSEAAHSGLYAGAVSEALLHSNHELAVQERLYPEKSSGKVPEKGLDDSRSDSYYNREDSIPAEEEELEPTAPSHR
ncbi:MAG: hypothetical protein K6G83_07035, partial [Lachnospiraceae bacterium]|nr:hypothetical protein [Lachnospiraceae bacterium]